MIQIYDKFSRRNAESSKIYTRWKLHIYSTMITQNMWSMGETICIVNASCKRFHSKIHSYEKMKKD
jgi:hypothetical protein